MPASATCGCWSGCCGTPRPTSARASPKPSASARWGTCPMKASCASSPSPRPTAPSTTCPPIPTPTRRMLRAILAARKDPATFVQMALEDSGVEAEMAPVHRDLQRHLTNHTHALVELPRDHGKTTQVCLRIVWELGNDPSLRVRLVCASDALAAERSRFLRSTVARSRVVRGVFPNLKPSQPWAADAFTVERATEAIGPSVAAFGIGTSATGARADLLICDDVVDVKAIAS